MELSRQLFSRGGMERSREYLQDRLAVGDLINVHGRLDMDIYPDDQGKKQYRAKIVANVIEFLTPRKDGRDKPSVPEDLTTPFNQMVMIDVDDEIPF